MSQQSTIQQTITPESQLSVVDVSGSSFLGAMIETTKPGITRMVTITAGVGFVLAVLNVLIGPTSQAGIQATSGVAAELGRWQILGSVVVPAIGCLLGTALAASGANALNQWMERDRDGMMIRTKTRPIPSGRATAQQVLMLGVGLSVLGCAVLLFLCGAAPAIVAVLTIVTYLGVYTMLKPVTPLSTVIGAFPGALPPMIGFSAGAIAVAHAVGTTPTSFFAPIMSPLGMSLFAILFVWQMPHFHAIGVMYAEDYARGGHRILAVVDRTGKRAALSMVVWSLALVGVSVVPTIIRPDIASFVYLPVAVIAGSIFVRACVQYAKTLEVSHARKAFIASVMYLPLLLIVLVGEGVIRMLLS